VYIDLNVRAFNLFMYVCKYTFMCVGACTGRIGKMRNACIISVGKSERKDNLGDIGIDGRIMLSVKIDLNNRVWVWTGFVWPNMRSSSGLLWTRE
jgi:hypothetical protein